MLSSNLLCRREPGSEEHTHVTQCCSVRGQQNQKEHFTDYVFQLLMFFTVYFSVCNVWCISFLHCWQSSTGLNMVKCSKPFQNLHEVESLQDIIPRSPGNESSASTSLVQPLFLSLSIPSIPNVPWACCSPASPRLLRFRTQKWHQRPGERAGRREGGRPQRGLPPHCHAVTAHFEKC